MRIPFSFSSTCYAVIKVNGEPITISDRNYLTKAQYLWYYLRPADEDIPAQPADEYTKQCKSGVLRKSFSRSGELSIAGKPAYVYGWIATVPKPGDLDDDENINRIAIMVRGKMAKDDMLNEIGTTALYSKYIFGELNAEFLDTDEEADITTSSRQDFFDDDERYVVLKKFIESELAQIRADWEAERSEAGEEEACKYEVVREWYSGLIGDEKKAAKQLFGKINQLTVTPDEKKDIFKHGILAFESLKLKNELSALQDVQPDNLDNIPLPIAVLQQFLGLFSMRSTRLKIVFMFMPDILKYTPFRFFESHTYHGRKKGAAPIGAAP